MTGSFRFDGQTVTQKETNGMSLTLVPPPRPVGVEQKQSAVRNQPSQAVSSSVEKEALKRAGIFIDGMSPDEIYAAPSEE